MFNRIQNGKSVMIAIPAGGCSPTTPLLIGNDLVGIPEGTYGAGATGNVTVWVDGAFRGLPLHTGDTPNVGDKLYWDNTDGYLTTTVGSNVWAGWAWPSIDGGVGAVDGSGNVGLKLKS